MSNIFVNVGRSITGVSIVVFALSLIIISQVLFTHALFLRVLPSSISGWERVTAAYTLSCAVELTLILVTANAYLLNGFMRTIAALASAIVTLFFFEAFDFTVRNLALRWFLGSLAFFVNMIFTTLFHSKWKEYACNNQTRVTIELLKEQLTKEEGRFMELTHELSVLKKKYDGVNSRNLELEEFRTAELRKLTCEHCGEILKTVYHKGSHMNTCTSNPKRPSA